LQAHGERLIQVNSRCNATFYEGGLIVTKSGELSQRRMARGPTEILLDCSLLHTPLIFCGIPYIKAAMNPDNKERTTRRQFAKEITAAALAGALSGMKGIAAPVPEDPENKEKLVAPCGLYCGACPMYLATQEKDEQKMKTILQQFGARDAKITLADLQCDGCIGGGRVAAFCRKCEMRACAESKPNVTRCADCPDFPCSRITSFNNDGMLHHAEVLENCRQLLQAGIKEWAKREEARWSCPRCRAAISWYDKTCSRCGAKRSERLFPLKQA
jgi:hypothetical protein